MNIYHGLLPSTILISSVFSARYKALIYYKSANCNAQIIRVQQSSETVTDLDNNSGKCTQVQTKFTRIAQNLDLFFTEKSFSEGDLAGTFLVKPSPSGVEYYAENVCMPSAPGAIDGGIIAKCNGQNAYLEVYDDSNCRTKSTTVSNSRFSCKTLMNLSGVMSKSPQIVSQSIYRIFLTVAYLINWTI